MAVTHKAFTIWTCDRCRRKESTSATVGRDRGNRLCITDTSRPEGWDTVRVDSDAKHYCPECLKKVRDVLNVNA